MRQVVARNASGGSQKCIREGSINASGGARTGVRWYPGMRQCGIQECIRLYQDRCQGALGNVSVGEDMGYVMFRNTSGQ